MNFLSLTKIIISIFVTAVAHKRKAKTIPAQKDSEASKSNKPSGSDSITTDAKPTVYTPFIFQFACLTDNAYFLFSFYFFRVRSLQYLRSERLFQLLLQMLLQMGTTSLLLVPGKCPKRNKRLPLLWAKGKDLGLRRLPLRVIRRLQKNHL